MTDCLTHTHKHEDEEGHQKTRPGDYESQSWCCCWCPLSGRIMWREEIFFWFGFWGVFKKTKSKNNDTATTVKTSSPPMAKAKQAANQTKLKTNLHIPMHTYALPTHSLKHTHTHTYIHSGTRPHMYKHALPNKCNENSKCE